TAEPHPRRYRGRNGDRPTLFQRRRSRRARWLACGPEARASENREGVPGSDQPLDEVEGPLQREIRRSGPPRVHPGVASEPRSEAVVSCTNGIAAIRTPFVQGACTNDNGAL